MTDKILTVADKIKMADRAGIKFPHYTNTDSPVDFPINSSPLLHLKGNLIDMAENGDFDVIVQGCNCFNTMGGGIAREIRERYPVCAEIDNLTEAGEYMKLGNWTEYDQGTFLIINAYTQYNMSQGTDVFEYTAFELILQKLLHTYGDKRIGFPYIGMGLAGGNAEHIIDMIEEFAYNVQTKGGTVTLVEFG
jgi:O-acetyl-ADP-ribose deacetylase (regulator of RNase III)